MCLSSSLLRWQSRVFMAAKNKVVFLKEYKSKRFAYERQVGPPATVI